MENYLGRNHNVDCILEMQKLPSESIDCILTDPPYKYLKNQKLEVDFDEQIFFVEAKRVLKQSGFVILFGRGSSFYRWNTMLHELGFQFKEEIIWNKSYSSSPVLPISRIHETISIFTKKNGNIKKVKIPYVEQKQFDFESIVLDIKRLKSALNNTEDLADLLYFIEFKKNIHRDRLKTKGNETTVQSKLRQQSQACKTLQSILSGMNEKSIIKEIREHYTSIHPTQKPVRLLERLIKLTTQENDIVLDPFSGSCSTLVASRNINRKYIGFEIDSEYYQKGSKRLEESMF